MTRRVGGGRRARLVGPLACGALTAGVAIVEPAGSAAGPGGQVTIYRDPRGVPHIEAGSVDALSYGTGYELAKERPFLTIGIRLFAQGRISELEGKDVLPADEAVRRDFYDAADVARQYALL